MDNKIVKVEENYLESQLAKFQYNPELIAKLKTEIELIKVTGVTDIVNADIAHNKRIEIMKMRTNAEKVRKTIKAGYLEAGKMIDNKYKEIERDLLPLEDYLQEQEDIVAKEAERQRNAIEQAKKEKLQDRIKMLIEVGMAYNVIEHNYTLEDITVHEASLSIFQDTEFDDLVKRVIDKKEKIELQEAEKLRLAKEEQDKLNKQREEQAQESLRLEALRKEQEAKDNEIKAQQQAEQAKIILERQAIEREKREIEHAKQLEIAKEQSRLKAIEDEKIRVANELKAKIEQEKADKLEAERLKALQPDKDKLKAFIQDLTTIGYPIVKSKEAKILLKEIQDELNSLIQQANLKINKL